MFSYHENHLAAAGSDAFGLLGHGDDPRLFDDTKGRDVQMESLIEEAWRLYHRAEDNQCVVNPSVPILFFGDSERYFRSPLRVITVGLNPSGVEFPEDDPFRRFRRARHVYPGILSGQFYSDYLDALNEYFRCDPYQGWFNAFEPLLIGMEGSYYDGQPNAVLHTDLCSPLATDPTWGSPDWNKLTDGREKLAKEGLQLWLRLARHLAPDVVLISVARRYLKRLDFPDLRDWETICTVERTNPYLVKAREIEITGGKKTLVVFGQAAEKPFGTVSDIAKGGIGRCIAEYVHGR